MRLFPSVGLRVVAPRLLPLTMLAMAMLLVLKSVALVRGAMPADAQTAPPATAVAPSPATAPPAAPTASSVRPSPAAAAPSPPPSPPPASASQPVQAEAPISASERALLLDLRKRREELDARAAQLEARTSVLAAAEARLTARVAQLDDLQKRLESLESGRRDRDEANWRELVKLYESMKPKDAAVIFNDLDLPVLLPVLDRMKPRTAAPILAAMLPERARLVTAELARFRASENAVPAPTPAATGGEPSLPPPARTTGGG